MALYLGKYQKNKQWGTQRRTIHVKHDLIHNAVLFFQNQETI